MGSALMAAAFALWAVGQEPDAGSTMIARAKGPIELGTTPVRVTLDPAPGKTSVAASLEGLAPGQRVYLVVKGLTAETSPRTPYGVYINLPPGTDASAATSQRAGQITYYNEIREGTSDAGLHPAPTFRSFDVTSMIGALLGGQRLTDGVTVTIVPERKSVVPAKARFDSIELVVR